METVDLTTVHHTHHHSSMTSDLYLDLETHTHQTSSVSLHSYVHSSAHKELRSSSLVLVLLLAPSCFFFHLVSCTFHRLSSARVLVHRNHGCVLESCGTHLLHQGNQHHCLLRNVYDVEKRSIFHTSMLHFTMSCKPSCHPPSSFLYFNFVHGGREPGLS